MTTEETTAKVPVTVEFCGGLETIFNGEKEKKLQVDAVERKRGGEDDDDDDDVDDDDANASSPSTSTTTATITTTVARVAAAAAAAADPSQAHMLFVPGSQAAVRPGVLVLVNDADWELCGGARARVAAGDRVTFISTLHGG